MVEVSGENYEKQRLITDEIDKLYVQLKEYSFHSVMYHKTSDENFAKLLTMGEKIIPYLFHIIIQHGGDRVLYELVRQITNENPVPKEHSGKFIHQTIAWLTWYVNSKYYPSDIYFGLVV